MAAMKRTRVTRGMSDNAETWSGEESGGSGSKHNGNLLGAAAPGSVHARWGTAGSTPSLGSLPVDSTEVRLQRLCDAWRGERAATTCIIRASRGGVKSVCCTSTEAVAAASAADPRVELPGLRVRRVEPVVADGGYRYYDRLVDDGYNATHHVADRWDMSDGQTCLLWVSFDVPPSCPAGDVHFSFEVGSKVSDARVRFSGTIEVLPVSLPPPSEWGFHLDLWQNPYSVAAAAGVEVWSDAHWALLEEHTALLADVGQKVITTTCVHQPWGTQTYTPYDSMVKWTRAVDGKSWEFDWTIFIRYVELCMRHGINRRIAIYSACPWASSSAGSESADPRDSKARYVFNDATTGAAAELYAAPGDEEYEELWSHFLADLVPVLRERGWLGITALAIDERPPKDVLHLVNVMQRHAPQLQVSLAGHFHEELISVIDDWSVYVPRTKPTSRMLEAFQAREGSTGAEGQQRHTTFYVCCNPERPNTFIHSQTSEACWLPWAAHAWGLDGFLRWAFDSWPADASHDARHGMWPAGDCALAYPGAQSSVRLERLREGIADVEKMRVLGVSPARSAHSGSGGAGGAAGGAADTANAGGASARAELQDVLREHFNGDEIETEGAALEALLRGKTALARCARSEIAERGAGK